MSSIAKSTFNQNKTDIDTLWKIHSSIAGAGSGRKTPEVEVLNKAAIIFITACWETYIEDVAKETFEYLITHANRPTDISLKVRNFATKAIFDQKDSTRIWDLADTGWKTIMQNLQLECLKNWLGDFNTPKTAQVDKLFEELIGLKSISHNWFWKSMHKTNASKKLDGYISIRGNIAHRTKHDENVYKNWGTDFIRHVNTFSEKTDNTICDYINGILGSCPWS